MAQVAPSLDEAKDAYARRAWHEAYERYRAADEAGLLSATDLASFAQIAWWCAKSDECLALYERSYQAHLAGGSPRGAARVAMLLFDENMTQRRVRVGLAWLARAQRHLEGDTEAREYAPLLIRKARVAAETGKTEEALRLSDEGLALAQRTGERDAMAMGLMLRGQIRLAMGDVAEGMALVDEATMAAVSGELELQTTGVVYCMTISACRDIADYQRASDWTDAAKRWCERASVSGFPGVCRVHRAEVMALRGALAKAEQEARVATEELQRWNIAPVIAEGFYEIGSIRLRMGDLPAAEEMFRQAHEMGHSPEPGLSLVRLAEGKTAAAHSAIKRALANGPSRTTQARLLPAAVEVAVAAGDLEMARSCAEELEAIAKSFGTLALDATARCARALVLLAEGKADEAQRVARKAIELWTELDAPYETACGRMLLARAARATGDEDDARLELAAAKATFERIGARMQARNAAQALGDGETTASDEPRVARTFLFTDIVSSTQLVGVIGDDAWTDLIRWHDDALRAVIAEHGGEEIRHQGDGFAVAFDDAGHAIDCAVGIQRRLADHRKTAGFAPAVRVGVHYADAFQRGLDYAGVGVHEAARVGALAEGGEILTTRATLDAAASPYATGASRTVQLKGIAEPVEVVSVSWR